MTEKKARPNRRFKLLVAVLVLLALAAAAAFFGYKTLRAERFEVRGNSAVPASEIIALSGIQEGEHFLSIDFEAARQALAANPYLQVNDIYFAFPDTVVIDVSERQAVAVIRQMENAVLISSDAMVLEILPGTSDTTGMLAVRGMAITGAAVGETVAAVDSYQVEALSELLQGLLESGQYALYGEVDMTYSVDIWLVTHEGMRVRVGQAHDLVEKLQQVRIVLDSLNAEGVTTGTLIATDTQSVTYSPATPALPAEGEGEETNGGPAEGEEPQDPEGGQQPLPEEEPEEPVEGPPQDPEETEQPEAA